MQALIIIQTIGMATVGGFGAVGVDIQLKHITTLFSKNVELLGLYPIRDTHLEKSILI